MNRWTRVLFRLRLGPKLDIFDLIRKTIFKFSSSPDVAESSNSASSQPIAAGVAIGAIGPKDDGSTSAQFDTLPLSERLDTLSARSKLKSHTSPIGSKCINFSPIEAGISVTSRVHRSRAIAGTSGAGRLPPLRNQRAVGGLDSSVPFIPTFGRVQKSVHNVIEAVCVESERRDVC